MSPIRSINASHTLRVADFPRTAGEGAPKITREPRGVNFPSSTRLPFLYGIASPLRRRSSWRSGRHYPAFLADTIPALSVRFRSAGGSRSLARLETVRRAQERREMVLRFMPPLSESRRWWFRGDMCAPGSVVVSLGIATATAREDSRPTGLG